MKKFEVFMHVQIFFLQSKKKGELATHDVVHWPIAKKIDKHVTVITNS